MAQYDTITIFFFKSLVLFLRTRISPYVALTGSELSPQMHRDPPAGTGGMHLQARPAYSPCVLALYKSIVH